MDFLINGIIDITLFIVFYLFLKNFLSSYIKKKAENLATKEDIGIITKITESTKAFILSKLHISQTRYVKEYELLETLCDKLVDLQYATRNLRPPIDFRDTKKSEEEIKIERLNVYQKAISEFCLLIEKKKPFYPKDINEKLTKIRDDTWKEATEYRLDIDKENGIKYWERAEQNSVAIEKRSNDAIDSIRNRIQYWEEFDNK